MCQSREFILALGLAVIVAAGEGSRFPSWRHKLVRPALILDLLENDPELARDFDVPALFEEATGVPLRTYMSMVFGIIGKKLYEDGSQKILPEPYRVDEAFFSQTLVGENTIGAFLDDVSATPDRLAAMIRGDGSQRANDFGRLADRPLIKIGNQFYPLDFDLLASKTETGVYWRILRHLPHNRQNQFSAFWGRLFEVYVIWVLDRYITHVSSRFYPDPRWADHPSEQVCDAIVVTGSNACFLECKGSTFTAEAKYSGDPATLKAEIDLKLVGQQSNKKGILQLIDAVEAISAPENRQIRGIDLSGVTKVFPVIVIRDDIAVTMCFNEYLNFRFKKLLGQRKNSRTITPLFCLAGEDIERMSTYLGQVALYEILEARWRAEKQLAAPFFSVNNPTMPDRERRAPVVVREGLDRLAQSTALSLFGRTLNKIN